MTRIRHTYVSAVLAALLASASAVSAHAQGGSPNFLDNLFGRPGQEQQEAQVAQSAEADLAVRLGRLESQLRQLTGMIEQLQFRNQQLEQQVKRMQEDNEFRFQELAGKGGPARPVLHNKPTALPGPAASPPPPTQPAPPAAPGRRSDAFDPTQHPNAPGAPHTLGSLGTGAGGTPQIVEEQPPVGAPGGRPAGAPLDLSTLAGNAANDPTLETAGSRSGPPAAPPPGPAGSTGALAAVAPPSASPKDQYDLGYGYVLRKDYALAEQTFRSFLTRHPNDRLAPDANYWLAESLFQRQRYRDAAEIFLTVSTKHETAAKAPDSLLRLGQSLAALGEKEAACATLGEVLRKYPRASLSVKQGVEREQKRVRC